MLEKSSWKLKYAASLRSQYNITFGEFSSESEFPKIGHILRGNTVRGFYFITSTECNLKSINFKILITVGLSNVKHPVPGIWQLLCL